MDQEVVLGTATYDAKDDYLKTVTNLLMKVNTASDGKTLSELTNSLTFYTEILISTILDPVLREQLMIAKEDVYEVEILKRKQKKGSTNLTDEEERQANLKACTIVIGFVRNALDKYYGFELKNSILV